MKTNGGKAVFPQRMIFGAARDGTAVGAWRLDNGRGMSAVVLEYGGTLQSLRVPDRSGETRDVVLGFDTLPEYEADTAYLGVTVGRCANRIGGAAFSLGGVRYALEKNDGENHLHGGSGGFHRRVWRGAAAGEAAVTLSRLSPDGEEGYPGALETTVTYALTPDGALRISYDADADRDTVVNLTNHSYFNLAGGGSALAHRLRVNAERFAENGPGTLPTGRLLPVAGTPFDFREAKPLGRDIGGADGQLRLCGGYDHNYALSGGTAAVLTCGESGLEMTVETAQPGLQLYTANFLPERTGKGGVLMGPRGAVCLETQLFPDGLRHYGFPSPVLRAGEHLHTETSYRFRAL